MKCSRPCSKPHPSSAPSTCTPQPHTRSQREKLPNNPSPVAQVSHPGSPGFTVDKKSRTPCGFSPQQQRKLRDPILLKNSQPDYTELASNSQLGLTIEN